jgi:hypothetical protein
MSAAMIRRAVARVTLRDAHRPTLYDPTPGTVQGV